MSCRRAARAYRWTVCRPPAQVAGDAAQAHALGEAIVDEGVMGAAPLGERAGRIVCFVALTGGHLGRRLPLGLGFRGGR